MTLPITFTEDATAEIKHIFETKNIPQNYGVRVGVKGSGCSGVSHILGFDKLKDNDEAYKLENGIPVFIEKKDMMHLIGITVDFVNDADTRGFLFSS